MTANKTVLVTGISGYIGHHCAAELLLQGYNVRGTVRDLLKGDTVVSGVQKVSDRAQSIEFFKTDLLSEDGWAAAMNGCDYVLHVASPFIMGEPSDPNQLIQPAVEGTKRVLKYAKEAGVKRIVLTSSTVAISSDKIGGIAVPTDWAEPDQVGSYAKSKILAERAAWDFMEAHTNEAMELVVINPGGVMGPTLTGTRTGTSVNMIHEMMQGKMPMIPDIAIGMVDVRDVAKIHVNAIKADNVVGKRFILASSEAIPMMQIAEILKSNGYPKVSTKKAPNFMLKFMALFNKDVKGMVSFLGRKVGHDISETQSVLGWEPTPIETSIIDMARSISSNP